MSSGNLKPCRSISRATWTISSREGDQPAESDHVRLFRLGAFEDLFARDHYSHVDHLVVIAGEDDPDNILANVVNIPLHRRQYDFSLRLDHFPRRSPGFLL